MGGAIGALGGIASSALGASSASSAAEQEQAALGQAMQTQLGFGSSALGSIQNLSQNALNALGQYYGISTNDLLSGNALANTQLGYTSDLAQIQANQGRSISNLLLSPQYATGLNASDALNQSLGLPTPNGGSLSNTFTNLHNATDYYNKQQVAENQYIKEQTAYNQQLEAYNNAINGDLQNYANMGKIYGLNLSGAAPVAATDFNSQVQQYNNNMGAYNTSISSNGVPNSNLTATQSPTGQSTIGINGSVTPPVSLTNPPAGNVSPFFTPPSAMLTTSPDAANAQLQSDYSQVLNAYNSFMTGGGSLPAAAQLEQSIVGGYPGWWGGEGNGYTAGTMQSLTGFEGSLNTIGGGMMHGGGSIPENAFGVGAAATSAKAAADAAKIQQFIASITPPSSPPTIGAAPIAPIQPDLTAFNEWITPQESTMPTDQALQQYYNTPGYQLAFGAPPPSGQTPLQNFQGTPGYQFELGQGEQAIQASASAGGFLNSPNLMKSMNDYAQGLANTNFNQYQSQLMNNFSSYQNSLAQLMQMGNQSASQMSGQNANMGSFLSGQAQNLGSQAAGNMFNTGTNLSNTANQTGSNVANVNVGAASNIANLLLGLGSNLSNLQVSSGQAGAAGTMNSSNAISGGLGQLGGLFNSLSGSGGGGGSAFSALGGLF